MKLSCLLPRQTIGKTYLGVQQQTMALENLALKKLASVCGVSSCSNFLIYYDYFSKVMKKSYIVEMKIV